MLMLLRKRMRRKFSQACLHVTQENESDERGGRKIVGREGTNIWDPMFAGRLGNSAFTISTTYPFMFSFVKH
jgi:hypothetical protein